MPSVQARVVNAAVRTLIRRRDWGNMEVLARRMRFALGAPAPYQWLARRGVSWSRVRDGGVRGEWLVPSPRRRGTIFYIHGGGFVACSPGTHRPITAALARRTSSAVFSVDYRLAPEARFPAALDDVVAAYRWLVTMAPGQPIAIAGDSAGGGLALSLAVHIRDAGWPPPACVVGFSPWTDLTGSNPSVRENDGRCAMFRTENIAACAAVYLGAARADDPRASPLFAELHGLPPLALQVGSTELLLDDSRLVHERVSAAGGDSRLSVYDDVMHCWQMLTPFVPEARAALGEAAAFIRTHFDAVAPTAPAVAVPSP